MHPWSWRFWIIWRSIKASAFAAAIYVLRLCTPSFVLQPSRRRPIPPRSNGCWPSPASVLPGPWFNFSPGPEVDALLAAPDQRTWSGRRDHAFILLAVQTGLRLSEMSGLQRQDMILGTGAHVRVIGKGRKERCTPLARSTLVVLKAWLREPRAR